MPIASRIDYRRVCADLPHDAAGRIPDLQSYLHPRFRNFHRNLLLFVEGIECDQNGAALQDLFHAGIGGHSHRGAKR